ncbi:MAG: hypothetical protein EXS55_00260 [Candidatus Magasanikbacteria bacterium]|nr:hypothetical protein [Candidatus Magasanikbacteria bacterium]
MISCRLSGTVARLLKPGENFHLGHDCYTHATAPPAWSAGEVFGECKNLWATPLDGGEMKQISAETSVHIIPPPKVKIGQ